MEKSTIVGILLLLIIVIGGLFYTGTLQVNTPTGKVIDSGDQQANEQAGYPTGRVVNPSENTAPAKSRKDQFLDDYFVAIDMWLEDLRACYNRCPENAFGYVNSECSDRCGEIYDDEEYFKTLDNMRRYSESEIDNYIDDAENDRRYLEISSKLSCLYSCPETKECVNNCLR